MKYDSLERTLSWLQDRLGLDSQSLSKLVEANSSVLQFSIDDNLKPKLAWLQEWLVLDDKSISKLVQKLPAVLGYEINKNLEPTIQLYYEDCVGSSSAIQLIANNPRILGSSLENRLKPRLVECQEAGIPIDTRTIQRIAMYTELLWSNSMNFQKNKLPSKEKLRGR